MGHSRACAKIARATNMATAIFSFFRNIACKTPCVSVTTEIEAKVTATISLANSSEALTVESTRRSEAAADDICSDSWETNQPAGSARPRRVGF